MPHYTYLIVGGGMTADAAAQGIREVDAEGTIGLISAESDPPYSRPALSKGLWQGKPLETIWGGMEARGVRFHLGRRVEHLNSGARRVTDERGTVYTYDRLLLATGGTPRRLPFGGKSILYYRTLHDYRKLRARAEQGQCFAVIGGGFIGSEIAAALAINGKAVTMLFPEPAIGARVYPADLAHFLSDYYRRKGIDVLPHATVIGVEPRGARALVKFREEGSDRERELVVDGVVAGLGIQPNIELAERAGLTVENGIVVDETLQTSHPNIYAAGDVASFYNPALDRRLRVEHEDNATTMGRYAGRAMAGAPEPYHHLPFFYSDLFDLGYEAVGELDARHETVAAWKEPYREGTVYYLKEGRVRGVLLWNVWDVVEAARALIAEPGPFSAADLAARSEHVFEPSV